MTVHAQLADRPGGIFFLLGFLPVVTTEQLERFADKCDQEKSK